MVVRGVLSERGGKPVTLIIVLDYGNNEGKYHQMLWHQTTQKKAKNLYRFFFINKFYPIQDSRDDGTLCSVLKRKTMRDLNYFLKSFPN